MFQNVHCPIVELSTTKGILLQVASVIDQLCYCEKQCNVLCIIGFGVSCNNFDYKLHTMCILLRAKLLSNY